MLGGKAAGGFGQVRPPNNLLPSDLIAPGDFVLMGGGMAKGYRPLKISFPIKQHQ